MGLKIIEYSDPTPPLYMHEHWVTYPRRGKDIEFFWFCLQTDWSFQTTHNFNTLLFQKVKAMLWSKIKVRKIVWTWSGVSFAEWFKSAWAHLQKVYKEPLSILKRVSSCQYTIHVKYTYIIYDIQTKTMKMLYIQRGSLYNL